MCKAIIILLYSLFKLIIITTKINGMACLMLCQVDHIYLMWVVLVSHTTPVFITITTLYYQYVKHASL